MIKHIIFDLKKNRKFFRKFAKLLIIIAALLLIIIIVSFYFHRNIRLNREKVFSHDEVTVDYDFEYKIYFDNESTPTIFTDAIVESINEANQSIELAIYSINIKDIVNALINKKKEGLSVKIVLPEKRRKEAEGYFKESGIDLVFVGDKYSNDSSDLMHHKFLIIDSDSEERNILFGSVNFTYFQEKFDSSYLIQTNDKEVISSFKNEFILLASGKNSTKKIRDSSYRIFSKKINYKNGFIELWFGPGNDRYSIKSRMIELINSTKQKIEIIAWQFNDETLYKSLVDKAGVGVNIKLISDDMFIWSSLSAIENAKNIEIVSDAFSNFVIKNRSIEDKTIPKQFNPYIHYHFIILDDQTLVTGTNNWGFAGFYLNDESILVTNIDSMVKDFSSIFDWQYKKNRNTNLDFRLADNNKIVLNQTFPKNSKIIFYVDNTMQKERAFEICYETEINNLSEINFPVGCNKNHTLIFIVDEAGKLLSSGYLN
jgi:phosphatidylserine/phosphatidylglycerophosphate/cardiolipin synthase-like enzyme